MNTRRVSVRGRAAQLLEVFTTLIISPTVIKEPGEGSHLVGLNEARSSEAADWLPGLCDHIYWVRRVLTITQLMISIRLTQRCPQRRDRRETVLV